VIGTLLVGIVCAAVVTPLWWWLAKRQPLWQYRELSRLASEEERQEAFRLICKAPKWNRPVRLAAIPVAVGGYAALIYYCYTFFPGQVSFWPSGACGLIGGVIGGALGGRVGRRKRVKHMREVLREFGIVLCLKCGYDLTGNESGVCPECGTSV